MFNKLGVINIFAQQGANFYQTNDFHRLLQLPSQSEITILNTTLSESFCPSARRIKYDNLQVLEQDHNLRSSAISGVQALLN